MCVIMIAKDVAPTSEMIEKAWDRNSDGGGVAWREKDKDGKILVHWKKGIESAEEMDDIMSKLPMPYVAHFRIASSGGKGLPFTHPFPIEPGVSPALNGRTTGYVLFHNGDWRDWNDMMLKTAAGFGVRLPKYRFNDTRAIAWLTYVIGDSFMEMLPNQRGVLFGPNDYDIYVGPGWAKINGVLCSNDYFWETKKHNTNNGHGFVSVGRGPSCQYGECNRRDLFGVTGFCPSHQPTPRIASGNGTSEVAQNAPFRQGRESTIPLISLALALKLCPVTGDRKISKNDYKRIVKCHERIQHTDLRISNTAIQDLITISDRLYKTLPKNLFGQLA